MYKFVVIYLVLINILTALLFVIDKRRAIKNKNRISERTLIMFSLLGGAFSALISMYLFKHKTAKAKFIILIPFLFLIWALIIMYLVNEGLLR